jgi:hypothetical protein
MVETRRAASLSPYPKCRGPETSRTQDAARRFSTNNSRMLALVVSNLAVRLHGQAAGKDLRHLLNFFFSQAHRSAEFPG